MGAILGLKSAVICISKQTQQFCPSTPDVCWTSPRVGRKFFFLYIFIVDFGFKNSSILVYAVLLVTDDRFGVVAFHLQRCMLFDT